MTALALNPIPVIFLLVTLAGCQDVRYVGCVKRNDGSEAFQVFSTLTQSSHMEVMYCVTQCWMYRYKLAGLQEGSKCYCSASTQDTVKVPEDECDRRCTGNCYQKCGGETALSVFLTGYVREPTFKLDNKLALSAKIGCYSVERSLAIVCPKDFAPLRTFRMSVALCVYYCDSMYQAQFATTSDKSTCCCSNSVTGAVTTKLSHCDVPCFGDNTIGCVSAKAGRHVATFQISRLPKIKRWPKTAFQDARWIRVPYTTGNNFESGKAAMMVNIGDASLSGLLAKKMAREHDSTFEVGSSLVGSEKWPIAGDDKREPGIEDVRDSVAVVEVPATKPRTTPNESDSNGAIIAAVVVGFAIFIAAFAFYMFNKKKNMENSANINTNRNVAKEKKKKKKKRKKKKRIKGSRGRDSDQANLI